MPSQRDLADLEIVESSFGVRRNCSQVQLKRTEMELNRISLVFPDLRFAGQLDFLHAAAITGRLISPLALPHWVARERLCAVAQPSRQFRP